MYKPMRSVSFFVYMPNPLSDREMVQLRKAMAWSNERLRPFRRNRLEGMKQFVGNNYSDQGGSGIDVPLNMIWLAVTIYLRHLVPVTPQSLVLTAFPALKPTAKELEIALNHLLGEIHYQETLRLVVMDSLFSMGILKCGIELRDVGTQLGPSHDAGQPFADQIALDDWVHDMTAPSYEEVGFAGNRYRVPYELAMANKDYSAQAKRLLKPREKTQFSSAIETGDHRAESLSQGTQSFVDEFGDFVDLWDLWLPRENLMVTMAATSQDGVPPLLVKEWEGPEMGPFHLLRFQPVPGNVMPIAPVQQWMDLAGSLNRLWRKLIRQAERQKITTAIQGQAIKDGERVRDSDDGEIIYVSNPEGIKTIAFPGADNQTHGFSLNMKNMLAYMMGNIDAIGGLSAQTSTLGQDEMLSASANRLIDDMRQTLSVFNAKVFGDLAQYLWEDPFIDLPLVKRFGEHIEIPFQWSSESREGDFFQYNFEIEPYSQRSSSPEERLAKLNEIMTQIVIPAQIQFDPSKYMRAVAKYTNLKELEDILSLPQESAPVDPGGKGGRQAPTTRTYERISRAGPSAKSETDNAMEQALAVASQGNGQAVVS